MTPDQLKKDGIEDFQLHYALETMTRLAKAPAAAPSGKVAAADTKPAKRK
jgi:hypothetical protein